MKRIVTSLRLRLAAWMQRAGEAALVFGLTLEAKRDWGSAAGLAAEREVKECRRNVAEFLRNQKTEADILNERLTRRYDPALALVEATNRAIEQKKTDRSHVYDLTTKQLGALEMQRQQLDRIRLRS